jgi:hypothetical protein
MRQTRWARSSLLFRQSTYISGAGVDQRHPSVTIMSEEPTGRRDYATHREPLDLANPAENWPLSISPLRAMVAVKIAKAVEVQKEPPRKSRPMVRYSKLAENEFSALPKAFCLQAPHPPTIFASLICRLMFLASWLLLWRVASHWLAKRIRKPCPEDFLSLDRSSLMLAEIPG